MITKIHKAETRGYADHGWLKAKHSFSFASYYDETRIHFGLLRVLNDDIVEPAMGFGTHPHDNMEIVTIPLEGSLEHKDSMGHIEVLIPGEIQIMSAGSGLRHSEYNHSKTELVNLLQIWVFPKERDIEPRYDQRVFDDEGKNNKFQTLVSPDKENKDTLWINQNAYFALAKIDSGKEISYNVNLRGNGVYIFIIEGAVTIDGQDFAKRDGIGIEGTEIVTVKANKESYVLAIEVPMT
jgi:redox-sensitive bicupin YhaK (pirin superfamily)